MSYSTNIKSQITIERTSKIGLLATFTANINFGISGSNTIVSYLWTAVPAANVTIATPTAATTNVTATIVGDVTLTCTATDNHGNTYTDSWLQKFDRVIDICNTNTDNNNYIDLLQTAFNHITTNDAANASSYLINIYGTCTDVARISPTLSRVHFTDRGALNVGIDYTVAGTYVWTGDGLFSHINSAAGTCASLSAGVSVIWEGIVANCSAANTATISSVGNIFSGYLCTLTSSGGTTNNVLSGTNTFFNIRYSFLGSSGDAIVTTGGTVEILESYLRTTAGGKCINATTTALFIQSTRFTSIGAAGVTASNLFLTNTPGVITNNHFEVSAGAGNTGKNVYLNMTAALTGPVTFANNTLYQLAGNNATNSCCLMIEGASAQLINIFNNALQILSTNPAMIVVQSAGTANWRLANNVISATTAGVGLTSSTTNGVVVIVALANLNYFNNVINGLVNGPITFN